MPLYEQELDTQLMLRVRSDNERAFGELHARYQRKLLAFFYGMSKNTQTANDLCQETFLRVWKVRRRYRASGPFGGYLFGIARMIWLESCRSEQRVWRLGQRVSEEESTARVIAPGFQPDRQAERGELEQRLFDALEALPEEQRMVFVMRSIEGLSLEEIASALDCPLNTVRSRRILAVKRLRHLLASVYEAWFPHIYQDS